MRPKRSKKHREMVATSSTQGFFELKGEKGQAELDILLLAAARLMIAIGVDIHGIQGRLEHALIAAASEASRFRNSKPNQSGIAAMTGINRSEVKKLLRANSPQSSPKSSEAKGISKIIYGWCTDPEFTNKAGQPKLLKRGSGKGTFDSLVYRYGGDLPTAAALRELRRRGKASKDNDVISLVDTNRNPRIDAAFRRLVPTIADLLSEIADTKQEVLNIETSTATLQIPDDLSLRMLKDHLGKAIPLFFEQANIAAGSVLVKRKPLSTGARKVVFKILAVSKK